MKNENELIQETRELSAEAVEELEDLEFVFALCGWTACGTNITTTPSTHKGGK